LQDFARYPIHHLRNLFRLPNKQRMECERHKTKLEQRMEAKRLFISTQVRTFLFADE
jgi:hypothetical protein